MNTNIIIIILGEPNSTFSEILFKFFKSEIFKKINKKIILIGSHKLLLKQMNKLNYKIKLNEISKINNSLEKLNILNVNYAFKETFSKISDHSNNYIDSCFNLGLALMKKNKVLGLINGPISKKHFLKKKFPGITEYVAKKTNSKEPVMLIYNKDLAVNPLTTHIPIKNVSKFIKKKKL